MPKEPESPPLPARLRLGVGAAIVLALVVLSAAVGWGILRGQSTAQVIDVPDAAGETMAPAEIYVHVLGQVSRPGLYVLDQGDRIADALAMAGGTLEDADLQAVNLARLVTDGEQILVPAVGESPAAQDGVAGAGDGLVDLNTADQAALETLPRIGPALAQRIIQWRQDNGRFASVDDLLAVPGIGEKMLAGLRDLVRT